MPTLALSFLWAEFLGGEGRVLFGPLGNRQREDCALKWRLPGCRQSGLGKKPAILQGGLWIPPPIAPESAVDTVRIRGWRRA